MRVKIRRFEHEGKITVQEGYGLAVISINRPSSLNALSSIMWQELTSIAKDLKYSKKARVIILRGVGGHLTAGSDIKEFHVMSIEEANKAFYYMEEAIRAFENLPQPTIATVDGVALGAGFELALACDLRVGTKNTKMGIPVGRLGIKLNRSFAKRISDLIGPSRTKDLVYTGRLFKGKECEELGLINYYVENEDVDHFVMKLGEKISLQAPSSLRAVKEAVSYNSPRVEYPFEHPEQVGMVDPIDFPEGISSFVEKRKPRFYVKKKNSME
ncbi:enoyl-CoA hydratase/isomerase family protein [Massilibacterium senegalense]|uniref:enoyl-CoA hydratase/isomerase family protein n=1 Tax=Massilibacterium senegalense TaxID=1632858 RepID=UPI0007846C2C|nr:enoyl-CoA hydratase/isomerase family protein [Massilibacterium senegalense]